MKKLLLGSLVSMLVSGAALAHHSPVVFDHTKQITIVGTVTEFKWSSPHAWMHIDVPDKDGKTYNWGVEMNPASLLARAGWKASTIKPGDKVEVLIYPLRNDEKGGQYISIKLPDGRTLGEKPDGVL